MFMVACLVAMVAYLVIVAYPKLVGLSGGPGGFHDVMLCCMVVW